MSYWQRTEDERLADQRKRYQRRPKVTVTPTWKVAERGRKLEAEEVKD